MSRLKLQLLWMPLMAACLVVTGCHKEESAKQDAAPPPVGRESNPPPKVQTSGDMSLVSVQKPEQFPLVASEPYNAPSELEVTGTVSPDIGREIPVTSLVSGRVVDIRVRLYDNVRQGQLLLKVQSPDSTAANDAYLKAVNDERMNYKAYVRAKDLFAHGAISEAILEQAEDAERDSEADLRAASENLDTLGLDRTHPSPVVPVYSPISGVIIQQNVTFAAAAGVTFAGSSTAFVVADLSNVWVVCDVYENDIPKLALRQVARITLNAYPDRPLYGRVSDIGPILDPTVRTAKVRIEVPNPGSLKLGMFVTAKLTSLRPEHYASVPAPSVLHLHDRDWVFVPADNNRFRRIEVRVGQMIAGNRQLVLSGIGPGQQVVSNVLQLESTLESQ